jgi:dienelactone hydrolase
MVYLDGRGEAHPVRTAEDWKRRRAHILANMQEAMGKKPDEGKRVPLDVQGVEEVDFPAFTRKKITFAVEGDDRVPAYLFIPKGLKGRVPAMLCLHQTTKIGKGEPAGLGGLPTLRYAQELAERGYACVVPDYPSFGDYAFDFAAARDRWPSGSLKAVWNNLRAVDLLESLPEVDRDAIGAIGHSLGGHNALFTAAFDQRIRAVVTSCGFTPFPDYYGGKLAGWTSDRYMPRIRDAYGNDPAQVPFDFPGVLLAIAPRAVFVSAPTGDSNFDVGGVRRAVAAVGPVWQLFGRADRLTAVHPEVGHLFPDDVRRQSYDWLDRVLRRNGP